jgi:signal-transduction protein with cAMP-binding, CBS, and nucleotidyltransferase domain
MDSSTTLSELMTPGAASCGPDDDLRDVEQKMAELQVRRIPIVDTSGRCLGIISQADIARASATDSPVTEQEIAEAYAQIGRQIGSRTLQEAAPFLRELLESERRKEALAELLRHSGRLSQRFASIWIHRVAWS